MLTDAFFHAQPQGPMRAITRPANRAPFPCADCCEPVQFSSGRHTVDVARGRIRVCIRCHNTRKAAS